MTKYQEALNSIIDEYIPMHYEGKPMNQQTEDALLLQELVDRDKPMKVVFNEHIKEHVCPACQYENYLNTFCGMCGQRLDWSEEE